MKVERFRCQWLGNPTPPNEGHATFNTEAAALDYERALKRRSTSVRTVVWALDEEDGDV